MNSNFIDQRLEFFVFLEKKDLTLDDILDIGKTRETAAHQSKQMEAAIKTPYSEESNLNE